MQLVRWGRLDSLFSPYLGSFYRTVFHLFRNFDWKQLLFRSIIFHNSFFIRNIFKSFNDPLHNLSVSSWHPEFIKFNSRINPSKQGSECCFLQWYDLQFCSDMILRFPFSWNLSGQVRPILVNWIIIRWLTFPKK